MLAAGVTVRDFRWIGCGILDGVRTGRSDYTSCSTWGWRAVPIFESTYRLSRVAASGVLKGRTVLLDLEPWSYTPPAETADPALYARRAAVLSVRDHFRLIVTLGGGLREDYPAMAAAARAGAWAVAVQSQMYDGSQWADTVQDAREVIHAARPGTLVIGGLGTNTAVPHTARQLLADVHLGLVVAYWLNADNWGPKNQCTATAGGPGCPVTGWWLMHGLGRPVS